MALASKLLVAAAALLGAGAAHAGVPQWTLSEATGDVTILVSGQAQRLAKGSAVPIGAAFVTGRNGSLVLARGDQTVALAPNSRLRVADPAPSRGLIQMFTDQGTATFQLQGAALPFAVSTPYLAAAGTGVRFSITVSDGGAQVKALDGDVQVITHDGRSAQRVSAGMTGLVAASEQDRLTINASSQRLADGFAATKVALKD